MSGLERLWIVHTLRKGELLGLTVDAVVQIGSAYWLRVPLGKLHNDRYIPLHQQLKIMIDDWLATRPDWQDSPLLFLSPTPLGVLQLLGVIGLLWWRGRVWWGKPLLVLTGGIYAYWLLGLASFVVANRHLGHHVRLRRWFDDVAVVGSDPRFVVLGGRR